MKNEIEYNFKFKIKSVFIILLIVAIIGILIFYVGYELQNKTYGIIEIMAYTTGSIAILSLIYNSYNQQEHIKYEEKQLEILKSKHSYDVISNVIKPEMTDSMKAFREVRKQTKSLIKGNDVTKLLKYFEENPKDHTRIQMLLNFFEQTSIQIKNNYIDEIIIKEAFKTMFINAYEIMNPYIRHTQIMDDHKRCWIEFEELCEKWKKED